MIVLIGKQDRPKVDALIKSQLGTTVTYTESSANAEQFEVSVDQMQRLVKGARAEGYNPYEIMFW